jgi:outer membrane protein, heavy metal efflux system
MIKEIVSKIKKLDDPRRFAAVPPAVRKSSAFPVISFLNLAKGSALSLSRSEAEPRLMKKNPPESRRLSAQRAAQPPQFVTNFQFFTGANLESGFGFIILMLFFLKPPVFFAQETQTISVSVGKPVASIAKYVDMQTGRIAGELVALALENNGEIAALRREIEAAEALVKQARLRPNPSLEIDGARQIGGADYSVMAQGTLPLELGGRRASRVRVAERELELKKLALADRERLLAAEIRAKFGETLASAFKLRFTEQMLAVATENYNLVAATVREGRRAPLEQNVEIVELNRLRAIRETGEGAVEIAMLELKNMAGLPPEEPLRLRGDFDDLIEPLPPKNEAVEAALRERPDLQASRAGESLARARIEQARAEGRINASVSAGFQRMKSGFPLQGIDEAGNLRPIDSVFNFVTFGIMLDLPARNRNQGAIQAAVFDEQAARRRREFGELTIRRETAAAYARFESAARAMQIYRVGVREQAAANLGVVRQTYELGSKPLFDYIAEQRRFIEIENGFIDAQLETYLARVAIWRATNAPELTGKK